MQGFQQVAKNCINKETQNNLLLTASIGEVGDGFSTA